MLNPEDVPKVALNDGTAIPQLGFGTYQVAPVDTKQVVLAALGVGYRMIDTAQMYGNESGVGRAIREFGLQRHEVYLTSKLNNNHHDPADARISLERSLEQLGVDYLDLFLIHWPLPSLHRYPEVWEAMIEFQYAGLTRSIGVSNFQISHLADIISDSGVIPAVNQIEAHPFFPNNAVRASNTAYGIVTEAWAPLARGKVAAAPVLQEIGSQLGVSAAQVALRWAIQRGDVIFPKSVELGRMVSNAEIFDFALTESQMAQIDFLDTGTRTGPDPDEFDWIPLA